jgi:hypothetical protein
MRTQQPPNKYANNTEANREQYAMEKPEVDSIIKIWTKITHGILHKHFGYLHFCLPLLY